MEFFKFLQKESKDVDRRLFFAGVAAGVVNTLLIFILSAAAVKASKGLSHFRELLLVVLCLWAYWKSKGYLMQRTTVLMEGIVQNIRLRIAEKIRNSDLASFETIGAAPLYNAISDHAANISRGTTGILSGSTSLVLLVCAFLVIYFLSATAFCILAVTLALIITVFFLDRVKLLAALDKVSSQDNRFVKGFGDLLAGFKELKMSSDKNQEFFEAHLRPMAATAQQLRIDTGVIVNRSVLLATSALFILLAAVVFLLPVLAPADAPKLARIATIVVFIFGPLGEVVGVYPHFTQAVASIREIYRVEGLLNSIFETGLGDPFPSTHLPITFETIRCQDLAFSYHGEKGEKTFSLAPIDLQLSRGELVFITGGNGSGKSTFLKVLAGLYPPASGNILVNQAVVGPYNRQSYRDLFAAVFSDFHLFDHLYGMKEVNEERVRELLHLTDLTEKISIVGNQITNLNLSTGQRKRLALVLALLEDKPIVLLDEWAAEQDPQFRRKFYREILPSLKRNGKTVVAVTHDDDHYDVADRVLKMQYGKFVTVHSEHPI
ncbi:MAG: cyclic peptide export ABC transporter [Limisphaerales bacterium]